jgi:hypothetical protein
MANTGLIAKEEVLKLTQAKLAETDMVAKVTSFTDAKRERMQAIL